jgi:hypothetical protein
MEKLIDRFKFVNLQAKFEVHIHSNTQFTSTDVCNYDNFRAFFHLKVKKC